jgi:hypothetical protein
MRTATSSKKHRTAEKSGAGVCFSHQELSRTRGVLVRYMKGHPADLELWRFLPFGIRAPYFLFSHRGIGEKRKKKANGEQPSLVRLRHAAGYSALFSGQ